MAFFSLSYPITRNYTQPWLGPVSFAGAFIAIVLLSVLNAALVGYETITVLQSDPNVTQNFWFNRFMPYRAPKPGKLCAPHVFNVGDTFTTQNAIFAWSMQSIEKPNAGASGVTYNGSALQECDVNGVYLTGDLRRWTVDYSVLINCRSDNFNVSATTSFSVSSLPGTLAPLLGYQRAMNSQSDLANTRAIVLDYVIQLATQDLGERALIAFSTNNSNPVIISAQSNFEFCPASRNNSDCAQHVPQFSIPNVATITSLGQLVQNSNGEDGMSTLGELSEAPIINIIQTIYAAVRIDLGIDSPNNYLLHKEVTNQTLNATFPVTPSTPITPGGNGLVSSLYNIWENPLLLQLSGNITESMLSQYLPMNVTGPTSLQVVYLCKFQSLKPTGSLIISVLVATLSMFSSGWSVYLLFLGMVATGNRHPNQCKGHLAENDTHHDNPRGTAKNSELEYMPVPTKQ